MTYGQERKQNISNWSLRKNWIILKYRSPIN
jgi:hypothetical protein